MKLGDNGTEVKQLQQALINKGYSLTADGIYGLQTQGVVRLFQLANKLTIDGEAGPETLASLFKTVAVKELPVLRSIAERVAKAWYWTTQKAKYILGEGGRSPFALTPFTPNKDGVLGSDCVGWVLWALGIDRYQPKLFTYYDGWMNTDSIIDDAKTGVGGGLWKILAKPEAGCLVIFPSLRNTAGKMTRMGHVGLVVEVPGEWPEEFAKWNSTQRKTLLQLVKVIDCNASLARRLKGKAISQITAADLWNKSDAVFVGWAG